MLPSGSTIMLNTLMAFSRFCQLAEKPQPAVETARGGVAHGGEFVGLHALTSDSEVVADVAVVKAFSASRA